ncbi:hypothetical protein [Paenibacillus ehimensis]|uniref:Plasmid replication protein RepL domain-containing protein n=1 Tax=Paenibacillus ehimensis TaxID=79264 RepID=A0ABT8VI10_9BACL|nr:hypothetical protein [Paenibacillus ehimensis]MDO3680624.1 hypothetical protein [Paenibacillus ehimensis]
MDAPKHVDSETGEILEPVLVHKRSNEIVRVFDPGNSKKNIRHVKLRVARKQKRVYEKLTIEERGFLFSMLPYLEWETNIVVGDGIIEEKNKPLNFSKIEKVAGISKPTRIKIVESLVEKKVIGFIEVRRKRAAIVINPQYALRGVKPDDALRQVFDFELDLEEDEEPD